jgi:Pentapeptide repeats (8 copies)
MGNPEHLKILKQGIEAWKEWRRQYPSIRPNLTEADLIGANLTEADLTEANLIGADLSRADLSRADLPGALVYCIVSELGKVACPLLKQNTS